jgi:cell division protease FtsH
MSDKRNGNNGSGGGGGNFGGFGGGNWTRSIALWAIILLMIVGMVSMFGGGRSSSTDVPPMAYSEFLGLVRDGRVSDVTIQGQVISGTAEGKQFRTIAPNDPQLVQRLTEKGVRFAAKPPEQRGFWLQLLQMLFPFILIGAFWFFLARQMQNNAGRGAMGFGKSRAKMLNEAKGRVTFADVAGIDEAREELQEIVEFLRDPQRFSRLGGKIPKGALLVGPPGTGKTLLARAIAGEANVPFFSISGSDFVEMFVGVGASRVRDMFEQAKKNAPCIVFIDEIDAVGRHRGAGLGGGNDEREQTLNQMLVEMDGFEANEGIIIVAATNRPDVLDPALLRPGRFDRQIVVPRPDIAGREKILGVHMKKVPLAPDVNAKTIARGTPGFSGADLANLVNEAALLAARKGKRLVSMLEFEEAKDKVMMGTERRSMVMSEDEKKATAYHEAGHALVTLAMPNGDPLHKVTIIPRGRALGVTMSLPERDALSYSKKWCEARLAVMFGGRVAEQLIYGDDHLNTGASNDIQQATGLARRMVTEWGMSDKLGPLRYSQNEEEVFLGHSVTRQQNMSEDTARMIDEEVKRLVTWGYDKAREVLTAQRDELERVTDALMEYETLSGDEVKSVMKGGRIDRPDAQDDTPSASGTSISAIPKIGKRKSGGGSVGDAEPQPQG